MRRNADDIRKNTCRYYIGFGNVNCNAGRNSRDMSADTDDGLRHSCFGETDKCELYNPFSQEEQTQREAEHERRCELLRNGLSPCCEAPVDESQVITSGRFKGHGSRYCSKCRKLLYTV